MDYSWTGFWLPTIVRAVVGGALSAAVGVVVTLLIRSWVRDLKKQLGFTDAKVTVSAVDAESAAKDAYEINARLARLEGTSEAFKDTISTDLGDRARKELRFRRIEDRMREGSDSE